ncbi:MAG: DUF1523 family protein [Paracoccaceae bacterium]
MRIFGWIITITFWTIVLAFFHYTLPQRDIVRVTDTYEKRIDFGENSIFWASADSGNDAATINRDVFFIQTRRADDSVMVYRNEDTGWGWPPYFKFDTSNLQAESADLRSSPETPKWAMLTHYGWRNEFYSIFPNAISITPVDGPDVSKPIPWVNIVILFFFAVLTYAIWVRWRRFRTARLDPAFEEIQDNLGATGDAIAARKGRFQRWLNTWRG